MPKATVAGRQRRRREVARLRAKGHTIEQLAARFGVANSTIIRDLQYLEAHPIEARPRRRLRRADPARPTLATLLAQHAGCEAGSSRRLQQRREEQQQWD